MSVITLEKEADIKHGGLMVSTYRGWHQLWEEEGKPYPVIDLQVVSGDLALQHPRDINEVIDQLNWLLDEPKTGSEFDQFYRERVSGSLAFIDMSLGRDISADDYVRATNGESLVWIPEEELGLQKRAVEDHIWEFGRYTFTLPGWRKFMDEYPFDVRESIRRFRRYRDLFVPVIQEVVGNGFEIKYPKESLIDHHGPWINRIIGGPEKIRFEINRNPKNAHRWIPGVEAVLPLHEMGGHLTQILVIKRNIENGETNPGEGLTTIPGVEQPLCEGLASTLPFLIPPIWDLLPPEGKMAVDHTLLRYDVLNNAHIIANGDSGNVPAQIHDLLEEYLPSELIRPERVEEIIGLCRDNPKYRAYIPSYSIGSGFLRGVAKDLDDRGKRKLVDYLYGGLHTMGQVRAFVN